MLAEAATRRVPWSIAKVKRRQIAPDEKWAEQVEETVLAQAHPWQRDAIVDPARFFTWLVGRGGGKTWAFRGRYAIGMARIPRGRFVYVAPTLGMATDLLWDPLKDLCFDDLAMGPDDVDFREVGKICTFKKTGATLRLVGADDRREMDKLRGQPFDGVGVDEAAVFPPHLLDWFVDRIIVPRLGERDGWLGLASTPGHILKGRFYDASRTGSKIHRPYARRDDPEFANWRGWSSIAWSLADVAALPDAARYPAIVANWRSALETKEREGYGDEHPVWMREFLGKWATDASELVYRYRAHVDGKPWNQWDPPRHGPHRIAELPKEFGDWNFGVGCDLGGKDPFALQVFAISPADPSRTLYHVYEIERAEMYGKLIAQLLLGDDLNADKPDGVIGALGAWPNGIVVDAAGLGDNYIRELRNEFGIPAVPTERKPGAKHAEIELFNGLLLDGRVKILRGSALEAQLMELRWKEDEFGFVKEDKAQANHSTDAAVYARRSLANLLGQVEPKAIAPPPRNPREPDPDARKPTADPLEPRRAAGSYEDPFPW